MTHVPCEETKPCFILAVLFALHGADATRTDCRDMEMPLRKGKEMTAIKVGSPTKIETLISRMKQSGGSTETVLANEAAAELAQLRAALEEARAATAKLEGVLGYVQFNCRECGGREYAEQQYASTQGDK